jgi:hypothetical protein
MAVKQKKTTRSAIKPKTDAELAGSIIRVSYD